MVDGVSSAETEQGDNPRVKAMSNLQKEIEDFSFNARIKYSAEHSGTLPTQDKPTVGGANNINYEVKEILSPDGKEWIKRVTIKRGRGYPVKEVFEIFRSVNGDVPTKVISLEYKDSSAKASKSIMITPDNVLVKQGEKFAPGSTIDVSNVIDTFRDIYRTTFKIPR